MILFDSFDLEVKTHAKFESMIFSRIRVIALALSNILNDYNFNVLGLSKFYWFVGMFCIATCRLVRSCRTVDLRSYKVYMGESYSSAASWFITP